MHPAGYLISPQDQGGNDATDSDADPISGQTATTMFYIGENDLTWDAGLYRRLPLAILFGTILMRMAFRMVVKLASMA